MDWGEAMFHVCQATGWTWEYVSDHVDLPRLRSMTAYWKKYPPLHVLVANYFGFPKDEDIARAAPEKQDFSQLIANAPEGVQRGPSPLFTRKW